MRSCNNRFVFALMIAAWLAGWSLSAAAQSAGDCYFTSYGDFICPKPDKPAPAEPAPEPVKPAQPQPEPAPPQSREPVLSKTTSDKVVDSALFKNCTDGIDNGNDGTTDATDPACAPVYNDPVFGPQAVAMNAAPAASGESCNLAGKDTLRGTSGNTRADRPATAMWDGDTQEETGSVGAPNDDTLWMEFDLKVPHTLTQARLFGEDYQNWVCRTWQIETRLSPSDPWQAASGSAGCYGRKWFEQSLSGQARYVRLTVRGDKGSVPDKPRLRGTQFREFQLMGAPVGGSGGSGSGCTPGTTTAFHPSAVNLPETNVDRLRRVTGSGGIGQALSNALRGKLTDTKTAAAQQLRPGGVPWMPSCTSTAPGRSFYVSPNGGGSSCSASSPCSLQAALDKAGKGDEVVLRDGRYYSKLFTKRDGVTIRAENPHRAIVSPPKGHDLGVCCSVEDARKTPKRPGDNFIRYSMGDTGYVGINHDNITVSGIMFDGKVQNGDMPFGVASIRRAKNVIFENNIIVNTKGAALGMNFSENVIIRHNVIGGGEMWSEGLYFAGNPAKGPPNSNIQFYGNIVQGTPSNLLDIKHDGNDGYDIHHNIFQGQVNRENLRARDGCLLIAGARINFHDNILRDSHCGTAPLGNIPTSSGSTITNNVFSNLENRNGAAVRYKKSHNFGATQITDNTFCDVAGEKICSGNGHSCGTRAPGGLKVSIGISPSSACDKEQQRIMAEMQNLPSCK